VVLSPAVGGVLWPFSDCGNLSIINIIQTLLTDVLQVKQIQINIYFFL